MSAGHGRGYYGGEQLDRSRHRSGSGWFKIGAVVGLGAVIWWWVLPAVGSKFSARSAPLPPPPPPPPPPPLAPADELERLSRAGGFVSAGAFEDAVVANARELKAAGARVELGPYLQHLESRLGQTP